MQAGRHSKSLGYLSIRILIITRILILQKEDYHIKKILCYYVTIVYHLLQ